MWELYILSLEGFGVSQMGSEDALESILGGFFHHIKVRQQIGRDDSIQIFCRRMSRERDFAKAAKNNEIFFKIQDENLKI
jgi:hypothetical protein